MGFQGTFKGTLKENFDRMMNPRKFLNEMDESNINELDNNSNDTVGKIIQWENGEMTDDETIDFFSELITTGQINGLQGMYGRTAQSLIDAGYLDRSGKVLMHTGGEMDESNINSVTEEVVMPNLTESYNRLQLLNKKLSKKNLNEVGFDQNGNPMGFDNSEEGYGDDPIDSRPKKGDAVYLQTPYPNIASRIMYIDSTHVFWKTDTTDQIDIGSKGGVLHIGQLRDKQLYNDLLTWMDTGDKTALETTKYTDI